MIRVAQVSPTDKLLLFTIETATSAVYESDYAWYLLNLALLAWPSEQKHGHDTFKNRLSYIYAFKKVILGEIYRYKGFYLPRVIKVVPRSWLLANIAMANQ